MAPPRARRVYLKNLSDKTKGTLDGNKRIQLRNDEGRGVVLTTPVLKFSLTKGVYIDDFDPTGVYFRDVMFTNTEYTKLSHR